MAHVQDEASGTWWRFDDNEVTPMSKGPFGEHADHGLPAEKKVWLLSLLLA